ncbi:MAG TPA: prenyltransferase/squalene oxidase repeat-containing protein [Solirubrobacterales bacterium]|nr:prenyltransferase/squalene oxidase repeat-containing protein [Solirubrobacterales bacterium]
MTWELASFLILGAVLVAGFVWYERSRPPSQVVALVAALAALAVAGRIAFAAFPNVKPTTDIVIFAGYALGGAPGFAVGALAALVSNFWFGQGPWTPWQMAGWGICGVLGAALALGTRNAGRLVLAATCGFAGILYGALLNFSLMATYGGDLSWERFSLLETRAIPFEVAHVGANVALALVAGPAMVRMLVRFRQRFEWRRQGAPAPASGRGLGPALRGGGVAALLLAVLALGAIAAPPAQASSASRAAAWLESVQNSDGGFGPSVGDDSRGETTCWVMLGLAASGRNPLDVSRDGRTPVDFLRSNLGAVHSPGDLARTILALESAGADPRDFGGRNLVADLIASRRQDGSYHGWPGSTAFAVIALRSAGVEGGVKQSVDWLRQSQAEDGGWGDYPGAPSTADVTGAVLQVLSPDSKASHQAVDYLRGAQRPGGGFPLAGNGTINTQSTAWAVQGLLGADRDPGSFKRGGVSAPGFLENNQRADGSYRYAKPSAATPSEVADQTPVFVTGEVLVAVAGKSFPIAAPARQPTSPSNSTSNDSSQPSFKDSGGLPSSTEAPPATTEPVPGFGSDSDGGAGGTPPGHSTPSADGVAGAKPLPPSPGGGVPEGSTGTAPNQAEPSDVPGQPASDTADSSTAGAIIVGLLAGCLLFLLALVVRKGWMHWRYGL